PLPGPAAGLLAGPPEPPLEDLADVLGVVVEVELPLDQPGDAGGGPEFVVPAVGLRTLRQQARQRPEVGVGQARCRGGWGLGVHPAGPPGRPDPPGHGLVVDAEHLGDGLAGLATGHSLHGLLSAAFQFSSGSKGSAHTRLDGYTTPRDRSACWTEYTAIPPPPHRVTSCPSAATRPDRAPHTRRPGGPAETVSRHADEVTGVRPARPQGEDGPSPARRRSRRAIRRIALIRWPRTCRGVRNRPGGDGDAHPVTTAPAESAGLTRFKRRSENTGCTFRAAGPVPGPEVAPVLVIQRTPDRTSGRPSSEVSAVSPAIARTESPAPPPLRTAEPGDPHAAAELLPLVYDELRKLAAAQLAAERPGQTLQPTALVHEAYLRLVGDGQPRDW